MSSPPPSLYDKARITQGFVVSGVWKNLPAHTSAHILGEVWFFRPAANFSNGLLPTPTGLKDGYKGSFRKKRWIESKGRDLSSTLPNKLHANKKAAQCRPFEKTGPAKTKTRCPDLVGHLVF